MISSTHRPTKVTIDLDAIKTNIRRVKGNIPKDTQVFAVVKANAYGHGAVKVAHKISSLVDKFCVSNLDEAIELRESGIEKNILVLGVVLPDEVELAKKYQITLTIASQEWLDQAMTLSVDLTNLSVHLKVDSGMGRIGLRTSQEANRLMCQLKEKGALIEGIFTHFATADESDDSQFNQQLAFFKAFLEELDTCPSLIHASNSATSLWHSDTIFNAVRLGIVIYGLNPSGKTLELPYAIQPALNLETAIIHVKKISLGYRVGYGGTYKADKEEFIATLPIGYADGFIRRLQGFHVLVDGKFCEIIGRVSMDQTTIRLPKYYPIGTRVVLIGKDKSNEISVTDMSDYLGTINYEVLCLLTDRIPRYYQKESSK